MTVVRYSIENKEKPMRKRSTQSREHYRELQAVGLQYCTGNGMDFRGRPEMKRVGTAGNRTRYQSGVYVST